MTLRSALFWLALLPTAACTGGSDQSGANGGDGGGEPAERCEGLEEQPADASWTVTVGERERTFQVHVPASYDPATPAPLVLNFHGFGSNAGQQVTLSGMNEKADDAGFVAVHPEGTGAPQSWNAGVCCGSASEQDVDDLGFVRAMLDELEARLCIDTERVFSTGMSNGGFFSHRLACELSDRIAAIAPVAGVIGVESCMPGQPLPVVHYHGTDDGVVPYDGSESLGFPSVEETITGWAERNGCDAEREQIFENGDSRCERFLGCPEEGPVVLCTVEGGGHTWPGGTPVPSLGHTTTDLSATDHAWDFFTASQSGK